MKVDFPQLIERTKSEVVSRDKVVEETLDITTSLRDASVKRLKRIFNMKSFTFALVILAAVLMTNAFRDRGTFTRPRPGSPGFPTFPGQGPFNPGLNLPDAYRRYRRATEVDNSLVENEYSNKEESSSEPESDPRLAHGYLRMFDNGHDSFQFEEESPKQNSDVLDESYIFNPHSPMIRRYLEADLEREA